MISFERQGTTTVVKIEAFVPQVGTRDFHFKFECGSEVYAGMLTELISEQLRKKIIKTRQKEYLEGLKTGRARGKKRDWHYSTLEP